jgi:nitrite reductase (NADH) small subunit
MSAAGGFHRVGSLAALRKDRRLSAMLADRRIAVFDVDGAVIATQGHCPHARGPIHEGELAGDTITCPWHGYCFNLRSGACEEDPTLTLTRFEVRIDGDDVLVRV